MDNIIQLYDTIISQWRSNRCAGTAITSRPIDNLDIIAIILKKVYVENHNPFKTFIVIEDFKQRNQIIDNLILKEPQLRNFLNKGPIKVVSSSFIEYTNTDRIVKYMCILYNLNSVCDSLIQYFSENKFKLVLLNSLLTSEEMSKLYKYAPLLPSCSQKVLDEIRTSTPVEEECIGISIPEDSEDGKLLKYYNNYIADTVSIFGSLDIMEEARIGNSSLNISATQICYQIAKDNGWDEHLDMSIPFNKSIDELYNPAALRDRAKQTYDVIRNRSNLLSSYQVKCDKTLEIVNKHKNENILIINKKPDFATIITNYLNEHSEHTICGSYHDNLEPIPAVDINGNPIYYKSGEQKGKRRMMAAKAQRTYNELRMNKGFINVLSTNNAPDKSLNIAIDVVIITSPSCEEIENYLYRLSNITLNNKLLLYTLYIKDSLEETKLLNRNVGKNHIIKNLEKNVVMNENNSDLIIVD